jgi:nucleoside-diphosphate-sugar epimerase
MKALVTGGAGFIGSHLSERLLEQGATVRAIDAFTDFYPRPLKERNLENLRGRAGYDFVEGDLRDVDLSTVLDGITHVFHLAAQAGVRKSWGRDFLTYTTNNVDATQRLLEAVKDRPLERFVYASSSSVYGDAVPIPMREDAMVQPVSPYGVTKLAAEHLCLLYTANFGVPTVSLRFFTVYGPRQRPDMGFHRFLRAALTGQPITLFGDGEQTRDFTYVDDIVAALVAAGQRGHSGGVYNIGGGSRVSINEVLAMVGRVTGRTVDIRREPAQKGDMRDTFADTSRAKAELGFAPSTHLEQGLRAEAEWLAALLGTPLG